MKSPNITAGRVTLEQCEDGSLVARIRRHGSSSQIVGTVAVPTGQLERWIMRLMRAELLPIRDGFPQSAPDEKAAA